MNKEFSYTAKIARVGSQYIVRGHLKSLILIPIESPCAILYAYISHRFPVIAQYRSNYRFWQGVPLCSGSVV